MINLPEGWELVKLKDILRPRNEVPDTKDLSSGKIPIVSKIRFSHGKIELRENGDTKTGMIIARRGDILISGINALKGAVAFLDGAEHEAVAATIHYSAYEPIGSKVDPFYIWFFMRSDIFRAIVESYIPAGIKTELKPRRLLPIRIPIPPLQKQKVISDIFRSIDDTITKTDQLISNIEHQKYALIENFFLSALRLEKSSQYKWAKVRLKQIVVQIQSGISPKCEARPAKSNEWGVLKLSSVSSGIFDQNENKALPDEFVSQSLSRYEVRAGDLLITRSNTPELVGMVCLVKEARPKLLLSDLIWRIVLDEKVVAPDFLNHYLKSRLSRQQIVKAASGTSGSMKKLSITRLKNIFVPLPPLKIQNEISSLGESFDKRISTERAYLVQLQETRKAIAQALLSGRVRVGNRAKAGKAKERASR